MKKWCVLLIVLMTIATLGTSQAQIAGLTVPSGSNRHTDLTRVITPITGTTITISPMQLDAPAIGSATIDAAHPGYRISPKYMGISHQDESDVGPVASNPNLVYRKLLQNLLAYGAGPIMLRYGSDYLPAPVNGVRVAPPLMQAAPLAVLAHNTWAHFHLLVNLCADDVEFSIQQMQVWQTMPAGSYEAIEIGNEPDGYHSSNCRTPAYSLADYFRDFAEWRTAIMPMLPRGVGLEGPSWYGLTSSSSIANLAQLPRFLSQEQQYMSVLSNHYYPGYACKGHTNPPEFLLQDSAAAAGAQGVAAAVTLAHNAGLPFRIGELNSIACGGEYGVSNIFAATLWMTDVLFEFANVGVDGVNVHTSPKSGYSLWTFSMVKTGSGSHKSYVLSQVGSEYYGLLFFQQATPLGSSLIPVQLTTNANLKVWATKDQAGTVRVVIINKDLTASGAVTLSLPSMANGTVSRLSAPTYKSMTGITIGGQTFDGSTTGDLMGQAQSETITPSNGHYTVTMPITSAAIVTLDRGKDSPPTRKGKHGSAVAN